MSLVEEGEPERVLGRERRGVQRRRVCGEGLGGREHLARHCAVGGNRTLLDGVQGLARHAIEQEEEAHLRGLHQRGHAVPDAVHLEECRGCRHVVVPDIVVGGLEVPAHLSRAPVQRHH
jgi:hypothetical protein